MTTYYVVALRDMQWYRDQVLTSASSTSGCQASRSHFLSTFEYVYTYIEMQLTYKIICSLLMSSFELIWVIIEAEQIDPGQNQNQSTAFSVGL